MAQKKTNKGETPDVTVRQNINGDTVKYGKVKTIDRQMSSYDKAFSNPNYNVKK